MMKDIRKEEYGKIGNEIISQYTLENGNGIVVKFIDYGAAITNIFAPDRKGNFEDVVLGFDNLEGYLRDDNPYFGCIVGRYANRIAGASFELDGKVYKLAANNGTTSLHGGKKGFDKKIWSSNIYGPNAIEFTYHSPDGEEGYPGKLTAQVIYSLTDQNEVKIDYKAYSDKPTPINLTHHSYFNLSAGRSKTILEHEIMINSYGFLVIDDNMIPGVMGNFDQVEVAYAVMDFRKPKRIGQDISNVRGGYDHNYILKKDITVPSATLFDPGSGRIVEVFTTEPGLQFYSGNFLDGTLIGKGNNMYVKHGGLCLEAQHFPNSPNRPDFPDVILRPGKEYRQTTTYKFSTK